MPTTSTPNGSKSRRTSARNVAEARFGGGSSLDHVESKAQSRSGSKPPSTVSPSSDSQKRLPHAASRLSIRTHKVTSAENCSTSSSTRYVLHSFDGPDAGPALRDSSRTRQADRATTAARTHCARNGIRRLDGIPGARFTADLLLRRGSSGLTRLTRIGRKRCHRPMPLENRRAASNRSADRLQMHTLPAWPPVNSFCPSNHPSPAAREPGAASFATPPRTTASQSNIPTSRNPRREESGNVRDARLADSLSRSPTRQKMQ